MVFTYYNRFTGKKYVRPDLPYRDEVGFWTRFWFSFIYDIALPTRDGE